MRIEARRRHDGGDGRLAFGQRAGLVDHQRIDLLHALERFGVADQHAGLRAAPDADHDRHRRREPERAGAGDDQHRYRGDQAIGEARLRPETSPGREGDQGGRDHQRHEPAGDLVGEPLDRRARALRLRHHLHDLRKQGVAADLVGAHDEGAALVDRAADHARALFLGDRHRFAGDEQFVDRRAAFQHVAVDRHLVARPHAQTVADLNLIERDFLVAAVGFDAPRGLRRQIEQRLDRAGCCSRARNSSTWPSRTSTVMTAADSK